MVFAQRSKRVWVITYIQVVIIFSFKGNIFDEKIGETFNETTSGCEKIWQFVMGTELVFMKQPIAVISVEDAEHNKARRCRYSLPDGEFFEYHPNTGKVKYNLQN